jgi:16S rRNA (guanine527-N7)-methyltransferase
VIDLSPDLERSLRLYARLLEQFGPRLGLIGPTDVTDLWDRHVVDSLRGLPCLRPDDRDVADVGSGAGLPGIPLALASPDRQFILVEANRRRAGFLELALENLRLTNAKVLVSRVEEAELEVDACLARAFAPPVETWIQCSRLLNRRGHVLYYAGRSWNLDIRATLGRAGVEARVCRPAERPAEGHIVSMSRSPGHDQEVNRHA